MKNIIFSWFMALAISNTAYALTNANGADEIVGVWLNANADGYIEISKQGEEFSGTIIGSPNAQDAQRTDSNNPDPQLRNRLLKGLVILQGFRYAGEKMLSDGEIYDPNNGKTYQCKLELLDRNQLSVRGYVGIPLFGRTEIWTRIE